VSREVQVAPAGAIPAGTALRVEVDGRAVAVFRVAGGALHAIDDTCPHRGGPLHEGFVEGFRVFCPLHGWQFDVRSGACLNAPGNDRARYEVREDAAGIRLVMG
jgi:nitrite reductase/ring-hydroxylating ferredoxin subunit